MTPKAPRYTVIFPNRDYPAEAYPRHQVIRAMMLAAAIGRGDLVLCELPDDPQE